VSWCRYMTGPENILGTWAGGYDGHVEWKAMRRGNYQDQLYYFHPGGVNIGEAFLYPRQPHTPATYGTIQFGSTPWVP